MTDYTQMIVQPEGDSHKGQNGRVLVIGGSELFHAAPFWAASAAAHIVDLVHFASPAPENAELVRVRAKEQFWEGIVVSWEAVDRYILEDDCILIGPGMPRDEGLMPGEQATGGIVDELLARYPDKRWVIDGGALQTVDLALIRPQMIVTPNARELEIVVGKIKGITSKHSNEKTSQRANIQTREQERIQQVQEVARALGCTVLAKGAQDVVSDGETTEVVAGGDPGMTKGGTGDVLSGIVAGLYAKSPALAAAVVASRANKRIGELLATEVGPYYTATEMVARVGQALHEVLLTSDYV